MGDIRIRFRMNMDTGQTDIVVDYESDEDQMRHEHERRHRDLVKQLVGEGLIAEDQVGEVVVERVKTPEQATPAAPETNSEGEAAAAGQ